MTKRPCRVLTASVVRVEKTDDIRGGGEHSSKRTKVNEHPRMEFLGVFLFVVAVDLG